MPLQGWWQVHLKYRTARNWIWEGDAGFRVHSFHFQPSTALGRIGFGRQFKEFNLTVGMAWFETWPRDGRSLPTAELRLYQKLALTHRVGPVSITHVYRAEERWFQQTHRTSFQHQLRLRYQLLAILPLQAAVLGAKPFAIGHTEIFLRTNHGIFSQYRLYGGLGLNWDDRWRTDVGYLAIWLPAKVSGNPDPSHALRTTLTYSW